MIRLIAAAWRRRQRRLDVEILWPKLKEVASTRAGIDLSDVRDAMRHHAALDPAWSDLTTAEIDQLIGSLR